MDKQFKKFVLKLLVMMATILVKAYCKEDIMEILGDIVKDIDKYEAEVLDIEEGEWWT